MSTPTPSSSERAASDRPRTAAAPAGVTSDDAHADAPCAALEDRRRDAYRLDE